jgi:hypothetical protein
MGDTSSSTGYSPVNFLVAGSMVLASMSALAAPVAAFLQPDPATSSVPYDAIRVQRGKNVIASNSPLQPCDQVTFLASQNKVASVLITTVQGGKNIRLDAAHPTVDISCEDVGLGEMALQLWKDISGGERATYSIAALSRGDQFSLPILSSEQSNIIASPGRSLYVAWKGGRPPFRVVLWSASDGKTISEVDNIEAHNVRMPEVNLRPGQYSLSVFNTPEEGAPPELREDNLFVVDASELPPPPAALAASKLGQPETELLYVYYLEGKGDGRWAFEAMQRAAAITPPTTASTTWLAHYGGGQ